MKSTWLTYRGKNIFHCNYSNLSDESFEQEVRDAEKVVCSQAPKSVLELTDLRGISMTRQVVDRLKSSSTRRKPNILFEAVVVTELSAPKRTLLGLISRVSGQPITVFESFEEAQNWLASK